MSHWDPACVTDLDLVLVADPRLPGAEARSLALLIDLLAARGNVVGLLPIRSPLPLSGRSFRFELAERLDDGRLVLLDSDRRIGARLLMAWHIGPLCGGLDRPARIEAGHAILRFDQVPWLDDRPDLIKIASIRRQFAMLAGKATTEEVAADEGVAALLGLGNEAWLPPVRPCQPSDRRRTAHGLLIGRHGGIGNAVWPKDQADFARAYPAHAGLQVDLLDPPLDLLRQRIAAQPAHLRLLPAGFEPLSAFLARLDAWHLATWLGRPQPVSAELLEAAASGTPLSLPREVKGWPEDAAFFHVGEFRDLPADLGRSSRYAHEFVQQQADGEKLVARLKSRGLGSPRTGQAASPLRHRSSRTVLMLSPNGVGMGHLTRLLAVARRMPAKVDPVFLTMSQAVGVIGRYGFHGEFVPYHSYYGGDPDYWNRGLLARLQAMVGFYDPRVILFDGNMPYAALVDLRRVCPDRRFVWLRRGLWRPETGKTAIDRSAIFDLIIEPGEFAAEADRGLTRTRQGQVVRVPPVTLLGPGEILDRAAARAELGISSGTLAAIVLLGSQNNYDYEQIRRTIGNRLGKRPDVVLVEAEWMISENKGAPVIAGARTLSGYPLARLFRAFDFAVSAAGYNSFHELLSIGIPTIFVPNENPSMDEQEARAAWAERAGLGILVRSHQLDRLSWALDALQGKEIGMRMRQNAEALPCTDGAAAIARLIMEQVIARDVIAARAELSYLAPHSAPLVS